ncbi:hypothetical protein T439DRAFT_325080 [Meredithblackwellia eburnea MCA 4105]
MPALEKAATRSSAQGIVQVNAIAQLTVLLVQTFFPRRLYNGPISKAVAKWTGLPTVELVEANSAAVSGEPTVLSSLRAR